MTALPITPAQPKARADVQAAAPRVNRRQLSKARSLQRLKTECRFLFENIGYFDVTIRLIAQRMGMSTGAVFSHAPDKESVWRLVMGGPAPSQALAEEVALIEAQRPGWSWSLRKLNGRYAAGLTSPDFHLTTNGGVSATGSGDSPASALRDARADADRKLPLPPMEADR